MVAARRQSKFSRLPGRNFGGPPLSASPERITAAIKAGIAV
jgi:hypothetical protein